MNLMLVLITMLDHTNIKNKGITIKWFPYFFNNDI